MVYPLIQPMAFRLDALTSQPDAWPDDLRTAYAMRFPPEWREILAPLALRVPRSGDRTYDTLPIRTLNRAIRALLPDIITVAPRQHMRNPAGPWLFSRAPISPQAIRRVVVAWAQSAAFSIDDEERKLRAAQQLLPDALVWEPCDLAAVPWTISPADTALPPADSIADPFRLLPELLAAHVASQQFGSRGEFFDLRRATLPRDKFGVELISWPPMWGQVHGKSWPFSFVMTLTLQTAPFERAPLLYADLSVRRWVAGSLYARNAMVYLATQAPWVEDAPTTPYFGVARIIRTRVAKDEWGWAWDDALPSILDQLKRLSNRDMPPFPSASTIANRSEVGLEFESGDLSGAGAAIMYHQQMKNGHGIGVGLMPVDRGLLIAEQLASALAPYCPLVDPLPRLPVRIMAHPVDTGAHILSYEAGAPEPTEPELLDALKVAGDNEEDEEGNDEDNYSGAEGIEAAAAWADEPVIETETGTDEEAIVRNAVDVRLEGLALRQPTESETAKIAMAFGLRSFDTAEQRQWQSAIARVGENVGIVLACQSGVTQLALVAALRARLGAETFHESTPASDVAEAHGLRVGRLRWELPTGAVTAILRPLGELGSELSLSGHGGVGGQRRAANDARAERAREYLRKVDFRDGAPMDPLGVIIELQGREEFARHADPKQALRLGCARAGAVTQFIAAYSSNNASRARSLGHRAGSAVADLLRQFGVQRHRPAAPLEYRTEAGWVSFPSRPNLRYIGMFLVSKKAKSTMYSGPISVPVVVLMDAEGYRIFGYAPGFDHPLPYPAALTKLAADLREADPRGVERFLEDTLRRWSGSEALVMARAQNLRRQWPWLQNGNLRLDQVMWGTAAGPISDWPGLRIVRVRDLEDHETPEWFGVAEHIAGSMKADARRGFSVGLWNMAGISAGVGGGASDGAIGSLTKGTIPSSGAAARLFASTGPKSSTQHVPLGRSRMTDSDQEFLAANPSLLELAVAAIQQGDIPLEWAVRTHALRMAASHWGDQGDALRLPLPLRLAELMGEYALLLSDDGDEPNEDSDTL